MVPLAALMLAGAILLPGPGDQGAEAAQLSEVKKLLASDGHSAHFFGLNVAVSGDTAVVSAWRDGGETGAVYLFERDQGGADHWGEVKKLTASDAEAGDRFGVGVAISGDTAIVGANREDAGGGELDNFGAAYVFQRNQGGAGNWGEVKKLTASDAEAGDGFGGEVALSSDTAVVGASGEDAGGSRAGAAYVFGRDQGGAGNWGEVTKLTASDAEPEDFFGQQVAVSGEAAIVGAWGEDAGGDFAGAAYVFGRDQGGAGNWGEVKKLTASDAQAIDQFGRSLAFSGDTAIVGALGEDAGGERAGAAYVFGRDEGGADNWGEVTKLTASDAQTGDSFGSSVAVSGNTAVAGAERDDSFAGAAYLFNTGAAYVFRRDEGGAGNWGQVNKLTASDAEDADFFGVSVAVSGDTAVAGAYQETTLGSAAGAAYVFDLQLPKPTPTPTPTACPTGKVPADSGCGTPTPTPTANAGPGVIERVGDVSGGTGMAISDDGRFVAFRGAVVDRASHTTQPLATGGKGGLDMSGDGRYVAFASRAVLVPEDDTVAPDVYVYDRELDSYELVSVTSDGTSGNGSSGSWDDIAINGDGRYVAFSSRASDLVPDDTNICFNNSCQDVFVRDRLLGTTVRVSVASDGTEGNGGSGNTAVSMSADGRFVAFDSYATNLVPSGSGGIYVRDRDTDEDGIYDEPGAVETFFVGEQGFSPAISDDGRFVAYHSWDGAANIVLLHDRQSGATTIVAETGMVGGGTAMDLSGDGRFLVFASSISLVPEDVNTEGNFGTDVYLYDRLTSAMELLSVAQDGSPADGESAWGYLYESLAVIALTPDGRYAAFHSGATNLVPGEGPGVFVAGTSLPVDTDGDGCSDNQELGLQVSLGGRRDPESFWDFFDVYTGDPPVRDRSVSAGDIGGVIARFGTSRESPPTKEEALAEAITPPTDLTSYHPAFDRNGSIPGQEPWNLLPPDGSITAGDIGAVVVQFGHTCA